jgi:hypothetical protein
VCVPCVHTEPSTQEGGDNERPGTPPSPFSPWSPWATNKRSFADALRSPLDTQAPFEPPALGEAEATLAPAAPAANAQNSDGAGDGPFTFCTAFATGALPTSGKVAEAPKSVSLFGSGALAPAAQAAHAVEPSLTATQELELEGHSISMRAIAKAAPTVSACADKVAPESQD